MFLFTVTPIYTNVVQEVYSQDCTPEVDDVEGLEVGATKHLELFKHKDKEGCLSIEKIHGKLLKIDNSRPFPLP